MQISTTASLQEQAWKRLYERCCGQTVSGVYSGFVSKAQVIEVLSRE